MIGCSMQARVTASFANILATHRLVLLEPVRSGRRLERAERWAAGAENRVLAEIVPKFLLQRLFCVDRREHAESLILQRRRRQFDRPFIGDRQLDAQTVLIIVIIPPLRRRVCLDCTPLAACEILEPASRSVERLVNGHACVPVHAVCFAVLEVPGSHGVFQGAVLRWLVSNHDRWAARNRELYRDMKTPPIAAVAMRQLNLHSA